MKKIEKVFRIKVDLLKLKPIEDQERVYDSYNKYLLQYFDKNIPKMKYFEEIDCPLCQSSSNQILKNIDLFQYKKCISCETIYNSPRLKKNILEDMYQKGEYNNYASK